MAGARPDTQGVALTRWSLPRLADHLAEVGLLEISAAHLGRVLAEAGLSFQRTRTWKASPTLTMSPRPRACSNCALRRPPTAAT